MGRALHRESGPSKNGNPVPGDLPFFSFLLFQDFFRKICFLFYFKLRLEIICGVFLFMLFFQIQYIGEGFVPLIDKVTFFLQS